MSIRKRRRDFNSVSDACAFLLGWHPKPRAVLEPCLRCEQEHHGSLSGIEDKDSSIEIATRERAAYNVFGGDDDVARHPSRTRSRPGHFCEVADKRIELGESHVLV